MEYSYFCTRIAPKTLSRGAQKASDMENKTLKRLPVGIQTYSEIVDRNCLYIDKTEYICAEKRTLGEWQVSSINKDV